MALALGCTLATVEAMSAAEFFYWVDFRREHGFPTDRIVHAIALSGAAVARALGNRSIVPADLIPQFSEPRPVSNEVLIALLSGLPGAKVEYVPHPDGPRKRTAGEIGEAPKRDRSRRLLNDGGKR